MMAEKEKLPRIVRFLESVDAGAGASCPHCGATGRYIHRFRLEDGREAGAMSGCVKLFPVHPLAHVEGEIRKKELDYKRKGWNLPSWDLAILDTLEDFYAGRIPEHTAQTRILNERNRAQAFRRRKYGRR